MRDLVAGIAVAAAAGLLMGAAMRPQLEIGDRPAGPQILTGEMAMRSSGPFDDSAGFAAYRGKVPDYVYGTDWKKQMAPVAPIASSEPVETASMEVIEVPALPAAPRPYEASPAEAASYPSIDGGKVYSAQQAATDAVEIG